MYLSCVPYIVPITCFKMLSAMKSCRTSLQSFNLRSNTYRSLPYNQDFFFHATCIHRSLKRLLVVYTRLLVVYARLLVLNTWLLVLYTKRLLDLEGYSLCTNFQGDRKFCGFSLFKTLVILFSRVTHFSL